MGRGRRWLQSVAAGAVNEYLHVESFCVYKGEVYGVYGCGDTVAVVSAALDVLQVLPMPGRVTAVAWCSSNGRFAAACQVRNDAASQSPTAAGSTSPGDATRRGSADSDATKDSTGFSDAADYIGTSCIAVFTPARIDDAYADSPATAANIDTHDNLSESRVASDAAVPGVSSLLRSRTRWHSVQQLDVLGSVHDLDFAARGDMLVAAGHRLCVYDLGDDPAIRRFAQSWVYPEPVATPAVSSSVVVKSASSGTSSNAAGATTASASVPSPVSQCNAFHIARFCPDGRFLATARQDEPLMQVWYRSRGAYGAWSALVLAHPTPLCSIQWRDETLASTSAYARCVMMTRAEDGVVRLWVESELSEPLSFFVTAAIVPPDAQPLASVAWVRSDAMQCLAINAESHAPPARYSTSDSLAGTDAASGLATSSMAARTPALRHRTVRHRHGHGHVEKRDVRLRPPPQTSITHNDWILGIVEGDDRGSVVLWNVQGLLDIPRRTPVVTRWALIADALPAYARGMRVARVRALVHLEAREASVLLPQHIMVYVHLQPPGGVVGQPGGRLARFQLDLVRSASTYQFAAGPAVTAAGHATAVQQLEFHPQQPLLASRDAGGHVMLWLVLERMFESRMLPIALPPLHGAATHVAWSHTEAVLFVATQDCGIHIYEVSACTDTRDVYVAAYAGPVTPSAGLESLVAMLRMPMRLLPSMLRQHGASYLLGVTQHQAVVWKVVARVSDAAALGTPDASAAPGVHSQLVLSHRMPSDLPPACAASVVPLSREIDLSVVLPFVLLTGHQDGSVYTWRAAETAGATGATVVTLQRVSCFAAGLGPVTLLDCADPTRVVTATRDRAGIAVIWETEATLSFQPEAEISMHRDRQAHAAWLPLQTGHHALALAPLHDARFGVVCEQRGVSGKHAWYQDSLKWQVLLRDTVYSRHVTPGPLAFSSAGSLVVAVGSALLCKSRWVVSADGADTRLLPRLASECHAPLAPYHPTVLSHYLMADRFDRVEILLCSLARALGALDPGDATLGADGSSGVTVPVSLHDLLHGRSSGSGGGGGAGGANASLLFDWGNEDDGTDGASQDDKYAALTDSVARALGQRLQSIRLPNVSRADQLTVMAIVELFCEMNVQRSSLDPFAVRYLISLRIYTYLTRAAPMAQRPSAMSSADWTWALHTQHEEVLVSACEAGVEALDWPAVRARGIPVWLRNTTKLRAIALAVARRQYIENRNPEDCALMYIALGQKSTLISMFRVAHKKKVVELLLNDFSDPRWRKAAEKNAFALMGKQRFWFAAAFFLLAGKLRDAMQVCLRRIGNDWMLALLLARLVEGEDSDSVRWLLEQHVLPHAAETRDRMQASAVLWLLHRHRASLMVLYDLRYASLDFAAAHDDDGDDSSDDSSDEEGGGDGAATSADAAGLSFLDTVTSLMGEASGDAEPEGKAKKKQKKEKREKREINIEDLEEEEGVLDAAIDRSEFTPSFYYFFTYLRRNPRLRTVTMPARAERLLLRKAVYAHLVRGFTLEASALAHKYVELFGAGSSALAGGNGSDDAERDHDDAYSVRQAGLRAAVTLVVAQCVEVDDARRGGGSALADDRTALDTDIATLSDAFGISSATLRASAIGACRQRMLVRPLMLLLPPAARASYLGLVSADIALVPGLQFALSASQTALLARLAHQLARLGQGAVASPAAAQADAVLAAAAYIAAVWCCLHRRRYPALRTLLASPLAKTRGTGMSLSQTESTTLLQADALAVVDPAVWPHSAAQASSGQDAAAGQQDDEDDFGVAMEEATTFHQRLLLAQVTARAAAAVYAALRAAKVPGMREIPATSCAFTPSLHLAGFAASPPLLASRASCDQWLWHAPIEVAASAADGGAHDLLPSSLRDAPALLQTSQVMLPVLMLVHANLLNTVPLLAALAPGQLEVLKGRVAEAASAGGGAGATTPIASPTTGAKSAEAAASPRDQVVSDANDVPVTDWDALTAPPSAPETGSDKGTPAVASGAGSPTADAADGGVPVTPTDLQLALAASSAEGKVVSAVRENEAAQRVFRVPFVAFHDDQLDLLWQQVMLDTVEAAPLVWLANALHLHALDGPNTVSHVRGRASAAAAAAATSTEPGDSISGDPGGSAADEVHRDGAPVRAVAIDRATGDWLVVATSRGLREIRLWHAGLFSPARGQRHRAVDLPPDRMSFRDVVCGSASFLGTLYITADAAKAWHYSRPPAALEIDSDAVSPGEASDASDTDRSSSERWARESHRSSVVSAGSASSHAPVVVTGAAGAATQAVHGTFVVGGAAATPTPPVPSAPSMSMRRSVLATPGAPTMMTRGRSRPGTSQVSSPTTSLRANRPALLRRGLSDTLARADTAAWAGHTLMIAPEPRARVPMSQRLFTEMFAGCDDAPLRLQPTSRTSMASTIQRLLATATAAAASGGGAGSGDGADIGGVASIAASAAVTAAAMAPPVSQLTMVATVLEAHPSLPVYLSGGASGGVHLWVFGTGSRGSMLTYRNGRANGSPIAAVHFNQHGSKFGVAEQSGWFALWRFLPDMRVCSDAYVSLRVFTKSISDFAFVNAGSFVAVAGHGNYGHRVALVDTLLPSGRAVVATIAVGTSPLTCVQYVPRLHLLCVGDRHGTVNMLDLQQQSLISTLQVHASATVQAFTLCAGQSVLVVACSNGDVEVLVIPGFTRLQRWRNSHPTSLLGSVMASSASGATSLVSDPRRRFVYTAGGDGSVLRRRVVT